ncbi:hypothetical protein I3842_03G039200 [Carya illinoinensis]|uniref:H15 domain-containing protein n=1 Tax=Carya illinoinensis TaxID=32201 RepID=A0A922FCF6_CARIL|nr:hypothetical protein I3842_03G039200 [Carya illinoinensis]
MQKATKKQEKTGLKTDDDPHYGLKINKIIDAAVNKYTTLFTYNALRPALRNHIEQYVCKKLSDLHTPDHPTYALMIRRAIEGLNEEGSTEEAISMFIKKDVKDLPWAHESFLRHHLKKLTETGEIVKTSENYYMLPVENGNFYIEGKHGQLNGTEDQIDTLEEQKPAAERSEQEPKVNEMGDKNQVLEDVQLLEEHVGKHNEAKLLKFELINEQIEGQKVEVIPELCPSQELQNKQPDEMSSQQGHTQRHEIEVVVGILNAAEDKTKSTGEQIQEKRADGVIQEQKNQVMEDRNLPHDRQIRDCSKQIPYHEEQSLLIEKLIELEALENQVTGKLNELQTEMRHNVIGLSDLQLSQESENNEAIMTNQTFFHMSHGLGNDVSLLKSKAKCIELLKRTKKIEEQLMDIINSSSVREVPKHDTLNSVMDEQKRENIKKSEQKQQVEFSSLKRPPEQEVEALQELSQNQQKQVKFCDQHEASECQPKSTGTSSAVPTNSGQLEDGTARA